MRYLIIVLVCLQLSSFSFGQQPAVAGHPDWIRVQSNNGDLSIDIPSSYIYYFNDEGLMTAQMGASTTYKLPEMRVVNSYINGTLISLESYRAGKGALGALYDSDLRNREDIQKADLKVDGEKVREVVFKDDKSFMVRRYINLGSGIYILTAASRSGETAEIRHFLDSLTIKSKGSQTSPDVLPISSLKMTEVTVEMDLIDDSKPRPRAVLPPPKQAPDPTAESLVVMIKPRAIYTDQARMNGAQGTVRLRVTFSENGFIPHIVVQKALPDGLLRQSLLSAVRLKFLPALKDGRPVTVRKVMEYTFAIY